MSPESPLLVTRRTLIRMMRLSDAEFIRELVNTPSWLRFIGDRNVNTLADAEHYLKTGFLKTYADHGFGYYTVCTHDEVQIGICGLLRKPYLDNPDFGFAYLPAYQERGYGFEAGSAVLAYVVSQFGLEALDAVTVAENRASIRLLEKLGFSRLTTQSPPTHVPNSGDTPLEVYRRRC